MLKEGLWPILAKTPVLNHLESLKISLYCIYVKQEAGFEFIRRFFFRNLLRRIKKALTCAIVPR
jgi:hypothetical protein